MSESLLKVKAYNFIAQDFDSDMGGPFYALTVYFSAKADRQRFARALKRAMAEAGHQSASQLRIPKDGGADLYGNGWGLEQSTK